MRKNNTKAQPFHPDYGYGDVFRLRVLLHSVAHGVAQAAKEHNVSQVSVYNWRKRYIQAFTNSVKERG